MATIKKRILPSGLIRWQVDFSDAGGKRRAKLFERRREADQFLVKVRPQVLAGTYVHDSVSITVGEAADAWLAHCRVRRDAGRRMERTTYVGYEGYVRCHIKDEKVGIGDLKLSRLSRKAVNDFRDRLLTSGRSEMITRKIIGALRLVLNHAIDDGQVHANAAQGGRVLRSSRLDYKVSVPAKQDVKNLIDGSTGRLRAMLVVSALCGLRASETRGLRWTDVDFTGGFLHVRQRADFYCTLGEPKSAAGHRSVPAGPFVLNALKEWKLACPKGDLDLVFPSSDGSVSDHANTVRRHFKPLCDKLKIKLRWHDMRHFAVSLWIEQGFSIKEVMTFAGHASVNRPGFAGGWLV